MKRATALFTLLFATYMTAAQTSPPVALTGKVMSKTEGAMEGVLIGAKKEGSTIATWVVSDAQGRYSFPRDRMLPGKYKLAIRAVGYELTKTVIDVTAGTATLDLQ